VRRRNGENFMNRLFKEYKLKNTIIKNRIVMPPMVCPGWSDDNGIVTEKHIKFSSKGLH
jgi:NADPH2 dehydrogenase